MSPTRSLALALFLTAAAAPRADGTGDDLLRVLQGSWQGSAVQTPVGPAPYDIHFEWTDGGCISGTADNSFSDHTWTFCRDAHGLRLDFLSDFRGNDQPIHLRAVSHREEAIVFHAESHPFMDVILSVGEETARADIIHYGELHVRIEWRREKPG